MLVHSAKSWRSCRNLLVTLLSVFDSKLLLGHWSTNAICNKVSSRITNQLSSQMFWRQHNFYYLAETSGHFSLNEQETNYVVVHSCNQYNIVILPNTRRNTRQGITANTSWIAWGHFKYLKTSACIYLKGRKDCKRKECGRKKKPI